MNPTSIEQTNLMKLQDNNGNDTLIGFLMVLLFIFILYMSICTILEVKREKNQLRITGFMPEWIVFLLRVAIPVVGVNILLSKGICLTKVASGSMNPKLITGNTVVYNRLAYKNHLPQRGDIISFWSDEFGAIYAKRVIGISGDHIHFQDGCVYINGIKADESVYISGDTESKSLKTFTVPEGCVFVLGDNREHSIDSRFWQSPYIASSEIIGKYMGQLPITLPDPFGLSDRNQKKICIVKRNY